MTGGSRGRSHNAQVSSADSFTATAPGRVNLIGEHTDYNGLPVLPIAIDRAVRIGFRVVGEPVVRLDSAGARFAPLTFQLKRPIEAAEQGDWSNYVRAAARGLLDSGLLGADPLPCGIEGTVSGDVPIAAGLSSSSALVVASALALLRANGVGVGEAGGGEAGGTDAGAAGAGGGRGEVGSGRAWRRAGRSGRRAHRDAAS